jgi:predicted HicB family RNase H-like nuclease
MGEGLVLFLFGRDQYFCNVYVAGRREREQETMANSFMWHKGYFGKVYYCKEDGRLYGKVAFIVDNVTFSGDTEEDAYVSFESVIEGYLEFCALHKRAPNNPAFIYRGKRTWNQSAAEYLSDAAMAN